jgi:hypothetical protein
LTGRHAKIHVSHEAASVLAALALAASVFTASAGPPTHALALSAQLGTPVHTRAGRTVRIDLSTKYVNAMHLEFLTIENHRGQSFAWHFDTLTAPTGFPLRRIAPVGFEAGNTWVYIDHPTRHTATD